MRTWTVCTVLALSGLLAGPLLAAPMTDPLDGTDSGWVATWAGSISSIETVSVNWQTSTVTIKIVKDFGPYEDLGGRIEFPDGLISFYKSGSQAVSRIIIQDETVYNNTGAQWTQFNWAFMEEGNASFVIDQSAGWTTAPFASQQWLDADDNVVSGNNAFKLTAYNGTLADGATFTPAGNLVIQHVSGNTIKLKEWVVPEPASLALLGAAAIGLLRRRQTRRA